MKMSVRGELVLVWFFLGYGLYFFTGIYTFLPMMIFFAPIFILHLLEKQELFEAWIFSFIGFVLAVQLSTLPFFDYEGVNWLYSGVLKNFIIAAGIALPYWLTRLVYHKNSGFAHTFSFPIFTTSVYFILSKVNFFNGLSGFSHYLQADNEWLLQFVSLSGIWITVFFISWTASIACWIWNNSVNLGRVGGGLSLYLFVLFILVFYGSIRISSVNSNLKFSNKTVRMAAVGLSEEKDNYISHIFKHENRPVYEEQLKKVEEYVIEAAHNDCRIIVFPEYSFFVSENDEKVLRDELSQISKNNKVYVVLGYYRSVSQAAIENGSTREESDSIKKGINCIIMFDATGEIVAEYHKQHLNEKEKYYVDKGKGTIAVAVTPFGNIALLSKLDMNYSYILKNAVSRDTDIVICLDLGYMPDKAGIHNMIGRSVESGLSVVNLSYSGLSYAIDAYGRIRSITGAERVLYADVPLKRVNNLYCVVGDLFAWITIVLSFILFVNVFFPFFNF